MSADPSTGFLKESFRLPHNRLLGEASELLKPVLSAGARAVSRGAATDPKTWRRGLILGHNHMGDVLYRTASLPHLVSALPACKWTYLTAPESVPLLENNPHVAEVLGIQRGENAWSISVDDFSSLRDRDFDVALCSNSLRYYPDLILATTLGIPNRVSFVHKGMSGLVTHPVPITFPSPYAAYFRSLVASVTGLSPDWSLRPEVFPDTAASDEAARILSELHTSLPVVACVVTTRQAHGNWPWAFLIDVLREARSTSSFVVAFCGSASEVDSVGARASSYLGEKAVVAGKLSLSGFGAFMKQCAALVTLDSGPRHLGNAVGIPVMFSRNMSHSEVEAGSYCDSEIDIAPRGEYLSDEEIERVAAATSVRAVANQLVKILSRESPA